MLGKIDIVMGSFSKTFASNGGFVACRSRAVKEYLGDESSLPWECGLKRREFIGLLRRRRLLDADAAMV
jgi:hypothetical protein